MEDDGKDVGDLVAARDLGLFRFQLEVTIVAAWKEVFPSDVVVVFYSVIGARKSGVAVGTCFGRFVSSGVVVGHGGQGNLFGKNFAYDLALRHDVVVTRKFS